MLEACLARPFTPPPLTPAPIRFLVRPQLLTRLFLRQIIEAPLKQSILLTFGLLALVGCAQHVTIRPPLNTSFGYPVFEALGDIHRAPVQVGLLLEQPLTELTFTYQGSLVLQQHFFSKLLKLQRFS